MNHVDNWSYGFHIEQEKLGETRHEINMGLILVWVYMEWICMYSIIYIDYYLGIGFHGVD